MNALLFTSEVDGHMYRLGHSAPFRKNVARWRPNIRTVADLKATMRAAGMAYGGTQLVLHMDDGADICSKCARSEFRSIAEAVRDKDNNGWRALSASMDNDIEQSECAHCGAEL